MNFDLRHVKTTAEAPPQQDFDLDKFKLNVMKHSTKQKISKKTDIYLVDTFGETKNFYNLSNIAFLGGSIVNHGGQNPLEAARLGNYIINEFVGIVYTKLHAKSGVCSSKKG